MSSDNPNPEQAQAKIALALGRLRGDVMPPITSQAAPRLQDQPVTPSSVNPASINAASPSTILPGTIPGNATSATSAPTSSSSSGFRADPTFNPSSASGNSGPILSSLNTNLSGGGLGNGAGVTPPVARPQTQSSGQQYSAAPSGDGSGSSYFGNISLDKDTNQPDLLSGVDMGPPPLGDTYPRAEDGDARRKRNRRVVLVGAVAAVVVIVGFWIGTRHHGDVPVITADATPEKVKPTDQGGLQVPNQNVQVLENMNGQPKAQNGETVLPPPEQPMAPPAPAQGDQSGQGTAATPTTGGDQSLQVPSVPTPSTSTTSDSTPTVPAPSASGTSAATPAVPAVPAVPDTNSNAMTGTAAIPAAPSATTTASAATTAPTTAPATPAATTTQQSAAKTTAPAATPGGKVRVQLAAVKSEEAARSTWAKLQKAHPAQLGNLSLIVEKVDKGTAGIFYRVQAGPLADKTTAKSICSALTQQNQACLVAR